MGRKTISLTYIVNTSQTVLIVGASLYLLVYLAIALIRLTYPFELEWIEGGCVACVQRILDHKALYVRPSLEFISYTYTPLYYYVSSLFAHVTGNGFFPLRLVSFLSSLGCFTFIFMIVQRRTSSFYASFISSCLFAAMFHISGAWFDIARVDSLFLFLLLAGIYAFDSPHAFIRSFVAPVIVFLSFYTKETALIVAVCLSLAALLTQKRHERFWFLLCFSFLLVGSSIIMNILTAGWYKYYVFDSNILKPHVDIRYLFVNFWRHNILEQLPIAFCICFIPFLNINFIPGSKSNRVIRDILILGGLFLASFSSRWVSLGSYLNVLMPAHAGIAIYFGIGMAFALKASLRADNIKIILILAAIIQFANLWYSPIRQIPSQLHREQGEKLLRLISSFKGEVYLSYHPWYTGYLNKPFQAQHAAIGDVISLPGSKQWKQPLEQEMAAAVTEKKYEAFIVDRENFLLRPADFDTHYKLVESNLTKNVFYPVTGLRVAPTYLYVRRIVQQGSVTDADKLHH